MSHYATQGEKTVIVKGLKEKGYRLKGLLGVIDLPRSAYYFKLNKMDKVKVKSRPIVDGIAQILHLHKGRYGVRRAYMELIDQGYVINHKKAQRIMYERKLFGKDSKEEYHSYQGKTDKVAGNLVNRDSEADRPL